ncbi:MAG TPA: hypothetical protein PKA27_14170 [Fimbriimonadaceae bacterium]|nr:hypothetical protein [Fimbriimonadaceae bacterium]
MVSALALLVVTQTPLQPYSKVIFEPIDEMSGIVKSRRWKDTYWVHNDSGDEPRIFAIRRDGSIIAPKWANRKEDSGKIVLDPGFLGVKVGGVTNEDWEDIAYDGDLLYLCDVGNNGNARRDLGVYAVSEPNPLEISTTRPQAWYPVSYEDQTAFPPPKMHFDCEAVFWSNGRLYFITKHRLNATLPDVGANLYVMPTMRQDRPNLLKKVGSAKNLGGWVTAADISPDGKRLAVLVSTLFAKVWVFEKPAKGDNWFASKAASYTFTGARQAEAICWNGPKELIVTNEQRDMFALDVSKFK